MMDIEEIREYLPHRFPMLLVDRILELDPGKRAVGLKNVTINEDFFNGHFPGQAMMPGVLILEPKVFGRDLRTRRHGRSAEGQSQGLREQRHLPNTEHRTPNTP